MSLERGIFNQTHPGFNFDYLWPIAQELYKNNPRDPALYHPHDNQSRITLLYDACVTYVGTDATRYSRQDVYDRVLLWRVPLIALVATTTLPSLGLATKVFTIIHLIADPIDTLWSLFYKLHLAERHANWAFDADRESAFTFKERPPLQGGGRLMRISSRAQTTMARSEGKQERQEQLLQRDNPKIKRYHRDVMASIINAYQEWHLGEDAKRVIESNL